MTDASSSPTPSDDLAALARLHGVDTSYTTWDGRRVSVPATTLTDVLAALDVDAGTPALVRTALEHARQARARRLLPPCVVVRPGHRTTLDADDAAQVWIELEDGGRREVPGPGTAPGKRTLPTALTPGYHTLHLRTGERTATAPLISAPDRIGALPDRTWGFTVQLYSALSERSWGMGDLADLADIAGWSGRSLEAGFVLVNPLHTMLPAATAGHSPYWPSSRRYPDPVHLRVEAVTEFAYLRGADRLRAAELVDAGADLRARVLTGGALIDRDAVWAVKQEALALIHRVPRGPGRQAAYEQFTRREGQRLIDFATFCALAERHGADWREWPAQLRDPRGAAVEKARRDLTAEVEFHRWLAWAVDEQLRTAQSVAKDAGMGVGIVHDLAVGAHPGGADTWMFREFFAPDVTVGAPPDAFTAQGQDWQQPPWRPDRLAEAGYAPFAEMLRGVMRHAGAVRMDHVLGLFRLWWVPRGRPLSEGAYVRYDHEAMLAVLALEARRAGVQVIGEDLGTVEDGVREELAGRGVLGTSVLWFEKDASGRPLAAEHWRAACLATLTTHDLPSTAARLSGSDLALRHRLGMLKGPLERERRAAEHEIAQWGEELQRARVRTPASAGEDPCALSDAEALHAYLAHTPARLLGVWLPDTVGDVRAQNLPGTFDEHPNWQYPIADGDGRPVPLEEVAAAAGAERLAGLLHGDSSGPPDRVGRDDCFARPRAQGCAEPAGVTTSQ
ncbi:4-alpha-glucanotransferase [Streptomyces yokosukanensis]|uniref:4-alpha-glucanotransferase n=1 Tax=Streptomyces yokosukanensis TaxID=67386 RepID=UPI000835EFF1|nr:4-alpha-glucanotransferase [Streptomyces yokosukanensis]